MFIQSEAIDYCVKPEDFKALDTANEKDAEEGGDMNRSLEKVIISCVVNNQPGGP